MSRLSCNVDQLNEAWAKWNHAAEIHERFGQHLWNKYGVATREADGNLVGWPELFYSTDRHTSYDLALKEITPDCDLTP